MTSTTLEQLVKPAAVAEALGIQLKTLTNMRYMGEGPAFVKIGSRVMYRADDVEAYIEAQTFTRTDGRK